MWCLVERSNSGGAKGALWMVQYEAPRQAGKGSEQNARNEMICTVGYARRTDRKEARQEGEKNMCVTKDGDY